MVISALERPASLVDGVCQKLSVLIREDSGTDERWLPAERLLAERLGVSRTVVREATKRLEHQGLLEVQHGAGIRVVNRLHKPLSGAVEYLVPNEALRLKQLIEVRFALEPENARHTAERATAADLKALTACHARFEAASTFEAQVQADMAFHCLLAEASGNKIAALLIQSLSELLQTSLSHGYSRVTKDKAVADHAKILRAILARLPAAAAKAMRTHLEHARTDLGL